MTWRHVPTGYFGIGGADFEFIRHIFLSGVTDITVCRNRTDGIKRAGSADGSAGYLGSYLHYVSRWLSIQLQLKVQSADSFTKYKMRVHARAEMHKMRCVFVHLTAGRCCHSNTRSVPQRSADCCKLWCREQAIFNALAELVNSTFGFSKRGLKAQCSTQPRASEATPWGFRIVEFPRPVRAKALILYLLFLLDSWISGLKVKHRMYFFNTCAMS